MNGDGATNNLTPTDNGRRALVREVSKRRISTPGSGLGTLSSSCFSSCASDPSMDFDLKSKDGMSVIDLDLQREYEVAVDCLVHCERIISSLEAKLETHESKLARKDDQIAALEEKMVQMSLELAKAQAAEDIIRSKRRTSTADTDKSSLDDSSKNLASLDQSESNNSNKTSTTTGTAVDPWGGPVNCSITSAPGSRRVLINQ